MNSKQLSLSLALALGSAAVAGCDLDVPDLNNPPLNTLEDSPTVSDVRFAASGMLIGQRGGKAGTTGLVNQLGILGREAYDFDVNDSRFVTEELRGKLVRNSAFGGVFWAGNYTNIRLGNIVLSATEKVDDFTEEDRQGIRGYVHTIQATEYFTLIQTHDTTGIVLDVDQELGAALAPVENRDKAYEFIEDLLDQGAEELAGAGEAFPFSLSAGYAGFNAPETFLTFNRALKARVAAHHASIAGTKGDAATRTAKYTEAKAAIEASFVSSAVGASLTTGVNYVFSTAAGDVANGLTSSAIFAHPGLATDAQPQALDATKKDARLLAKTVVQPKSSTSTVDPSLTTNLKFGIYRNNTPIPLIRNEELILLRSEIRWFTGDKPGALADLNFIRVNSGRLAPIAAEPATDADFITALLYERRYSLMFEGGHRWTDLRRFGIPLPLDSEEHVRNVRYPLPQAECDARPGEPRCAINSIDDPPAELL